MYDLMIIGAGPAGLTAAIYAGRFRLQTLILERVSPGGQIVLSPSIENYPGFPGGITTSDLVERFKKQVEELGVAIESGEVREIRRQENAYTLKTDGADYQAKSIIIATGAQAKQLGVPGENKFLGRGVSYCGTCDGPLFKSKFIAVVGGGDRAIEEAIFLARYASQVNLVHRRSELRAAKILIEKAKGNPKINFVLDSIVEEITGASSVEAIKIKNLKSDSQSSFPCAGVFIFVGIKPNTDFLKKTLEMNEEGFVISDDRMATSLEGIFACGDCRKKSLYQVVSACGEGAVAADSAHRYLLGR